MEKVCPICNGMETIDQRCPNCSRILTDGGILENYYGPYSPYMDIESLQHFLPHEQCIHLLYCTNCHYDRRVAWKLIPV